MTLAISIPLLSATGGGGSHQAPGPNPKVSGWPGADGPFRLLGVYKEGEIALQEPMQPELVTNVTIVSAPSAQATGYFPAYSAACAAFQTLRITVGSAAGANATRGVKPLPSIRATITLSRR